MLPAKTSPTANRLLAALPRKERQHLLAGCEEVDLAFATVLCEPGEPIRHVYFPADSSISVLTPVDGSASVPGRDEGMLGIPLVLGVSAWALRGLVQGSGRAWRMNAASFRSALDASPALQRALNRYLYVLMAQLAQAAACTRFHVVETRLARLLLMTQDRAHPDHFHITHEFLACMLGVRRVGVTKAATSLQSQKLISYSRGNITIRNRGGLEAAACTCYRADKDTYDQMMGR